MPELSAAAIERLLAEIRRVLESGSRGSPDAAAAVVAELGAAVGAGPETLLHHDAVRRLSQLAELGRISAETIHELRQPLVALKAYAEMFPEFIGDDEWIRGTAAMMFSEAKRMEELVNRVQRFARATHDRRRLGLEEPARAAADLLRPIFRQRHVELEESYGEGLPAVDADPAQLQQVLVNLLANAADAASREGAAGRTVVRTWGADGAVHCDVEDDGPGIEPGAAAHIFEPFFTTKEPGQGSGLGLAIARTIALEHGGALELVNAVAGATTFRLTLPAK
ncbi:MAG TPA: HAMP domain-containing sensor histidine kinase [Myxococcota bacterium]|jgi:two-component system NtrC family sensor kinase|nr:HAMP domain-containing sensor histidine kinase [Myxococcota bacterium]